MASASLEEEEDTGIELMLGAVERLLRSAELSGCSRGAYLGLPSLNLASGRACTPGKNCSRQEEELRRE